MKISDSLFLEAVNIRYQKQIKDENKARLDCHKAINNYGRSQKSYKPGYRSPVTVIRLKMMPLTDTNYVPPAECTMPEAYRTTNHLAAERYFARRQIYLDLLEAQKEASKHMIEDDEEIQIRNQEKDN
jgi:hypothetical protein